MVWMPNSKGLCTGTACGITTPHLKRRAREGHGAEAREHRLGFFHYLAHNVAGRFYRMNKTAALPRRKHPVVNVALVPAANRGGFSDFFGLERKPRNFRLSGCPIRREFVANEPARLSAMRTSDDGAASIGGRDFVFVILVGKRLLGGNEAGPHPQPLGSECHRRGKTAAVAQAATG